MWHEEEGARVRVCRLGCSEELQWGARGACAPLAACSSNAPPRYMATLMGSRGFMLPVGTGRCQAVSSPCTIFGVRAPPMLVGSP